MCECDDAFACGLVGRTTAPDGQLALHSGTKILQKKGVILAFDLGSSIALKVSLGADR